MYNLEALKYNWQTVPYSDSIKYIKNQGVFWGNGSYICIKDSISNKPSDSEYWKCIIEGVSTIENYYDIIGHEGTSFSALTPGDTSFTLGSDGFDPTYTKDDKYLVDKLPDRWMNALTTQSSMYLMKDGTVCTVGRNEQGQLGVGNTLDRQYLTRLDIPEKIIQIAIATTSFYALTEGAEVYSWGYNGYGQLGHDDTVRRTVPTKIEGLTGVVKIIVGEGHHGYDCTGFLKADGSYWSCGYNNYGCVGDGTTTQRTVPTLCITDYIFKDVIMTSGRYTTVYGITPDDYLVAWGCNESGEIGDNTSVTKTSPVETTLKADGVKVKRVMSSQVVGMVISFDDNIYMTGHNSTGGQCDGTTSNRLAWHNIGLTDVADSCNFLRTCLSVKNNGVVYVWGHNNCGQLGLGDTTNRLIKEIITLPNILGKVIKVFGHGYTNKCSYILTNLNELYSCGANGNLQLGDGTNITRNTFYKMRVPPNIIIKDIRIMGSDNASNVYILEECGNVWLLGYNATYGKTGLNVNNTNIPQFTKLGFDKV
jgi:alpha-tubulin suppressor-like RCC1 family protein